jgi:hypothetical protein
MIDFIPDSMKGIAKKVSTIKHLAKVIEKVDVKGKYVEHIGNTGVEIEITKGSVLYYTYQSQLAKYRAELESYKVVKLNQDTTPTITATIPEVANEEDSEKTKKVRKNKKKDVQKP